MSGEPDRQEIRTQLDAVIDPCSAANGTDFSIIDMGLLDFLRIDGGDVTIGLRLTTPMCMQIPYFAEKIEDKVGSLSGIQSVTIETDGGGNWNRSMMKDDAQEEYRRYIEGMKRLADS